eukprot:TRINITY_DN73251_c0_g1_i1.p1 TRINITY_DN73251_c0_g1~~TRINITY_DN73251_c0_g1_i1.p1  ORF type:complete len:184 (-),score=23.38 TRINITY_DN73251_c0_g1_i1:171-722(-)
MNFIRSTITSIISRPPRLLQSSPLTTRLVPPGSSTISSIPSLLSQIRTKNTSARKLHPSLRNGPDNMGLDYGVEIFNKHRLGKFVKEKKDKNPLGQNQPFAKGIVLRTLVKKPKKPNSANRKCVLVRLPSGKEMTAYVPGEGHNLQEHNQVLVKVARLRDTPGVKLKCVRGKYDLLPVVKKST